MVWMRQNKELNIKCSAKNDIFPNSRNMNKGSLCHHSCTLILNVHHFHVGVRCPDHHILPRIADAYNLIHRPNTLCRMRDSHITHNLPRVDATSLDLNIALACIRWHLTGTPLLSRSSWTFLKKSEHDWQEQTIDGECSKEYVTGEVDGDKSLTSGWFAVIFWLGDWLSWYGQATTPIFFLQRFRWLAWSPLQQWSTIICWIWRHGWQTLSFILPSSAQWWQFPNWNSGQTPSIGAIKTTGVCWLMNGGAVEFVILAKMRLLVLLFFTSAWLTKNFLPSSSWMTSAVKKKGRRVYRSVDESQGRQKPIWQPVT